MEDLFNKLVSLPRPKNTFHQKPTSLPRSRKLAHSLISKSVKNMSKFEEEEMMKKKSFTENTWYAWLIYRIPGSINKNGRWS